MTAETVRTFCNSLENEVIAFTQELVRIKSYTHDEEEIVKCISRKMISLGYDEIILDDFGNVAGRIGNGDTTILFDSHCDTVAVNDPEEWITDPFGGEIIDGKIYGRGSVDMKGAIAATIYAGYAIKELSLDEGKTIYVSCSILEEDLEGEALLYLCEKKSINPDFAVICEPSSLKLALGHRGRAMLTINTEGVSAHGSSPELGDNAIYKAQSIIGRIEKLQSKLSADNKAGSVTLSRIESRAVSLNAVPDHCKLYLDRRLEMGETEETVAKEMDALLKETEAQWDIFDITDKTWTGKSVSCKAFFLPWELKNDHPLTRASIEAFNDATGKDATLFKWNFSTNGFATASKLGIPTIGLGPGDPALAHCRDEHCEISEIVEAMKFYTSLVKRVQ
ncbi:MAG: YgeY family selenium metabolism-linked hydrolase [Desulfobulbaceae bacterium]|nr:YgeY family selenium metabolism-linked hydrolase [Desulfobulbaceae bacterium]